MHYTIYLLFVHVVSKCLNNGGPRNAIKRRVPAGYGLIDPSTLSQLSWPDGPAKHSSICKAKKRSYLGCVSDGHVREVRARARHDGDSCHRDRDTVLF
jgi:hypothetical protein